MLPYNTKFHLDKTHVSKTNLNIFQIDGYPWGLVGGILGFLTELDGAPPHYTLHYTVYSMQYTVCSITYTVYSIQYAVNCI